MSDGEKTFVFWIGLILFASASVVLFSIIWFNIVIKYQPPFELQVPFIVAAIVFILIGLYMVRSGVRTVKEKASTTQW